MFPVVCLLSWYQTLTTNYIQFDDYVYPPFALAIGYGLSLSSLMWIPLWLGWKVSNAQGEGIYHVKLNYPFHSSLSSQ